MQLNSNFIAKEEIEKIHEATLYVLEKVGVQFCHKDAIDIFTKYGAKVKGDKVFITEKMLQAALDMVPSSFILRGREKNKDVIIGGNKPVFAQASGPVYVRDGDTRRFANTQDFINFTKLTESSKVLNVHNANMLEPQDIPNSSREIFRTAVSLKLSTKPLMGFTTGRTASLEPIRLSHKFLGSREENILLGIISTKSPLAYDYSMLEGLFVYAEEKQPLMFACCSLPGATSPVSLAGTLVTNNAEVLAGIVLSQLVRPGFPVIYGNTSSSCDLRYVAPAIGSAETALITMATSALSDYYGIPCRSGGSLTDSKIPDMQAGIEGTLTMLAATISGIDFVLQSCGILESFNVVSYEKYVIDEQLIEMAQRFVSGFEIDDKSIGLETIQRIGSDGHYLEEEHTMLNFRKEHFVPKLFSREGYDLWKNSGAKDITERAKDEISKRLEEFIPPKISKGQENILTEYFQQYGLS